MRKIVVFIFLTAVVSFQAFGEMPVVTVLDFQMNSVSENDMKSIISYLSASLHDTGVYRVIDTAQRDTILEELAFSNTGCTDESCQLEIGKLLSAEYIITGDVALVDERYVLSARMLETETSATVNTGRGIYPGLGEMIDGMQLFAAKLSGDEAAIMLAEAEAEKVAAEAAAALVAGKEPISGREIAALSTLGAGAVAAGIGGYLLYAAFNYKSNNVDPVFEIYNTADLDTYETAALEYYNSLWDDYETEYSVFKSKLLVSSIVAGAGIASMITSAVLFLINSPPDDSSTDVVFAFSPTTDAATLSCRIRM